YDGTSQSAIVGPYARVAGSQWKMLRFAALKTYTVPSFACTKPSKAYARPFGSTGAPGTAGPMSAIGTAVTVKSDPLVPKAKTVSSWTNARDAGPGSACRPTSRYAAS